MDTVGKHAWQVDGQLDADIVPRGKAADGAGALLLTGATGYLGRHLLSELLARPGAPIYCLARPSAAGGAAVRVMRALQAAGGGAGRAMDRVRILDADLSMTRLGLSSRRYAALAEEVSTIIHCAADVSWSKSYANLRGANVTPVSHLLRLACRGRPKHFALTSSMAVCYSTDPLLRTDEQSDPATYLDAIPLGYAQSKAVAEGLVRQAAARGLNATIFRPSLIMGHTVGAANAEDFVAWLLSGCIHIGCAPDTEWRLDVVPVDFVAAAIRANLTRPKGLRTLHIAHPQPRAWRELVLFLNLFGYGIRLEPFDRWLKRLIDFPDKSLPLRRFIKFFSEPVLGGGKLSLSQIYESGGKPRISHAKSVAALARQGLSFPRLGADYFARYLASLAQARLMEAPTARLPTQSRAERVDQEVIGGLQSLDGAAPEFSAELRAAPFRPEGSITLEISSWRHGGHVGLYGVASPRAATNRADLILKISALDEEANSTAIEVASCCRPTLGRLFARFSGHLDFIGTAQREAAIYTSGIPAIAQRIPRCYAVGREPRSGRPMLLLERLTRVTLLNSVDRPHLWREKYIRTAIRDLASIHAVAYETPANERKLAGSIQRLDAARMLEPMELWSGLNRHATPFLEQCGGGALSVRIAALLSTAHRWMPDYALQPATLTHNDCNPRNMAFKLASTGPSSCLYDWELCTIAPAQRDLAEFLCFTLRAERAAAQAPGFIELHRSELSNHIGRQIDVHTWNDGFRLALADLMVRRISVYTMLHSYVRQTFLPRVVRTWQALDHAMQ